MKPTWKEFLQKAQGWDFYYKNSERPIYKWEVYDNYPSESIKLILAGKHHEIERRVRPTFEQVRYED